MGINYKLIVKMRELYNIFAKQRREKLASKSKMTLNTVNNKN
jgi:hypothetical protein